jgi:hypothetical protein
VKRENGVGNRGGRHGNRGKELLRCFPEAGKQMGELSDEAVLDALRRCRKKAAKARSSGTKDGKKKVLPRG